MKKILTLFAAIMILVSCGPKSTIHPTGGNPAKQTAPQHTSSYTQGGKCSIPMRRDDGVCYVDVKINGVDMEVIFDTGASDVVISSVEAMFLLKQGKLSEDDIIGTSNFQVADGSISSGTVIQLKSVQIGTKVLDNVRATVIDNMDAPLLLGQSALNRFSSVSIDYTKNIINIE